MDLDSCIRDRRSCRSYTTKRVSIDVIGELLEAATYAPSAGNRQNWMFVVVMDEDKKYALAMASAKQLWMTEASAFIVVCDRKKEVVELYPDKGELYAVQNCSLAIENLLLKGHDLGLGTCWIGAFDVAAVRTALSIPDDVEPEAIITLGYPEKFEREAERHPVDVVTFFDEYGNKKLDESIFPLAKHMKKIEDALQKGKEKSGGFLRKLKKK